MSEHIRDRFKNILKRVHYKNWDILVHPMHDEAKHYYLQVHFTDSVGDSYGGRKWLLSSYMTDSEIVQTALLAVLTAEEHEAREQFTYLDEPIFAPHLDIDKLFDLTNKPDAFAYRPVNRPGIPVMEENL